MSDRADWKQIVRERLGVFGHRNWIVVADAAYPAHSGAGIETVRADCGLAPALSFVLGQVDAAGHLRANVLTDLELRFVAEEDAPGITCLRNELERQLGNTERGELLHEQIIARLDEAARLFQILIVKTSEAVPYTSVFLELGCGYWNSRAEARLREGIELAGRQPIA